MTPFRWFLVALWVSLGVYAGFADDWQLVPEASSSDDVSAIRQVITDDVLVSDPSDCTELETRRLVMQGESGTYEESLAECQVDEADSSDEMGPTVNVSEIEVDGDQAHARANAPDGDASMFTFTMDLIRESGQWKIDYISEVEIDRPAFDAMMAEELSTDDTWTTAERHCILSRHRRIPTEELQRQFIEEAESALEEDLKELAFWCMGGERLNQLMSVVLRERALAGGVPARYADCFARQFLARVPRFRIRELLARGKPLPNKYCAVSARACATVYPGVAQAASAQAS